MVSTQLARLCTALRCDVLLPFCAMRDGRANGGLHTLRPFPVALYSRLTSPNVQFHHDLKRLLV